MTATTSATTAAPAARHDRGSRRRGGRHRLPTPVAPDDPGRRRGSRRGRDQGPAHPSRVPRRAAARRVDDRDRRSTARRVKAAGFPREKYLEDFDHDANPTSTRPAPTPSAPGTGSAAVNRWPDRGLRHRQEPPCSSPRHGRGDEGIPGQYTLATRLVNRARRSRRRQDPHQDDQPVRAGRPTHHRRARLRMSLDTRGAELLFQVMTEREGRTASRSPATVVRRVDQDLHRPAPVRCDRRPPHLWRHHHRTGTASYRLSHARHSTRH